VNTVLLPWSTGAAVRNVLRLCLLPAVTLGLVIVNEKFGPMTGATFTALCALAIALFGIPHGTLDVEITALRYGLVSRLQRLRIVTGYLACTALIGAAWIAAPEFALCLFLVVSILHFSRDWYGEADPFLSLMVAWALVATPALSKPDEVAAIFNVLTGNENGRIIADLLACASVPALLGCLTFVFWSFRNNQKRTAVEVLTCLVATLFLPPLLAFAIFFCGLHSPRHMADALVETGSISKLKKAVIVVAVFLLSVAGGVILLVGQGQIPGEAGVIRSAIILISILTVPHFILESIEAPRRSAV
jgi:beta-carotene 15,15'-dioxygenase